MVITHQACTRHGQVGGYAYLTQVSGLVPTTAMANPIIAKVREQALLREFIRSRTSSVEDAYGFNGDIAEVRVSMEHVYKPTDEDKALVNKNLIIITDKVSRGDGFIAQLHVIIEKEKPDLVWVNPLHSFAGCDISDAQETASSLRIPKTQSSASSNCSIARPPGSSSRGPRSPRKRAAG